MYLRYDCCISVVAVFIYVMTDVYVLTVVALLPTAPVSVSVLVRSGDSLLVSWREPEYNPSAVSGYIVFYKKQSDTRFRQVSFFCGQLWALLCG